LLSCIFAGAYCKITENSSKLLHFCAFLPNLRKILPFLQFFYLAILKKHEILQNLAESCHFSKKHLGGNKFLVLQTGVFTGFLVHIANFHEKKNLLVWQHTKWKCYFTFFPRLFYSLQGKKAIFSTFKMH